MRTAARLLPVLLIALSSTSALAQGGATSLLAGYGGVDHEASLGPAFHLNLRHRLVRWDTVTLSPPGPNPFVVPGVELQVEGFAQLGQSGVRFTACTPPGSSGCTSSADPLLLLGAGLVTRVDMSPTDRPVGLYFLPLTAALYLRGYDLHEWPLGSMETFSRQELRPGVGAGNGLGVRIRWGAIQALLEVRAVLIRDLQGGRGGSLPVSVGITW